jgi:hypothetical protein
MPSWNDLLDHIEAQPNDAAKSARLRELIVHSLAQISQKRNNRNVIFYASAFLQKPGAHPYLLQIMQEDLNGFMATIYGLKCPLGLTLILHTPGGQINAAESIVSYLWSKFPDSDIEVIVPTFAMSAGTMISLAANRIIMGRPSQLGPIDPQMVLGYGVVSANAIVDQFKRAKEEYAQDPNIIPLWIPILQSFGPALLQEAENALKYGEEMVRKWLEQRMFKGLPDAKELAKNAASYFNDTSNVNRHRNHGHRIDRDEARSQRIEVYDLEDDQPLQEAVLTAYHLITIAIEKSVTTKMIVNHAGKMWVKGIPINQPPNVQ